MKNKRTKLTAILLSALMAVSTISSVSWAADLFSDGSDEIEVVESNDEVVEVEDEVDADDASLTGISLSDLLKVEFKYDSTGKVVAEFTPKNSELDKFIVSASAVDEWTIKQTCTNPENAVYRAPYEFEDGVKYIDSNNTTLKDSSGNKIVSVNQECGKWKYDSNDDGKIDDLDNYDSGTYTVNTTDGYIVEKGATTATGKLGHNVIKGSFDARLSTCKDVGLRLTYFYCKGCNALFADGITGITTNDPLKYTSTKSGSTAKELKTATDVLEAIEEKNGKINFTDNSQNALTFKITGSISDEATVTVESTGYSNHVYDETNLITLTDKYYDFWLDKNGNNIKDTLETTDGWVDNGDNVRNPSEVKGREKDLDYNYIVANGEAYRYSDNAPQQLVPENGGDMLQFAPLNCIGTQIADPENGRDAYYYIVERCKYCNTVKYHGNVILNDVSNEVIGDCYEKVDEGNVIGFFDKNDKNKIYLFDQFKEKNSEGVEWDQNQWKAFLVNNDQKYNHQKYNVILLKKIPKDYVSDSPEPVFARCGKMGYYYLRTYEKDVSKFVKEKLIEVNSTHAWGKVELVPKAAKFIDNTSPVTEYDKLLPVENDKTPQSNGYVVVKDSRGNVTEAKSLNCITTAKYQLGQQCAICGKWNKYGDVKTAGPNTDKHNYGDWSTTTDDSDDKYYQIEGAEHDTYHMRYTYNHRICSLCGKRDLKVALEKKEAHQLLETAYDDDYDKDGVDSTYVAPTCGELGYYDVILRCACRYEDTKSRKQTTIPATDKHEFGDNKVELVINGDVQIGNYGYLPDHSYGVYAEVVRKCINCDQYDSNGISNTPVGKVGVDADLRIDNVKDGRTIEIIESRKDANGNSFPCLPDTAKITFNWSGKVDGKETIADTAETTVPYYPDEFTYAARRNHQIDVRYKEVVKPTATQEGSREKITFCTVCNEVILTETEPVAKLGSAPAVKATAVNYNTVTVSWDAVEGAESYKVFNKSNALGISKWQLVATVDGTSYTDTGLVTGAKYRYTVKPIVNDVGGEYSKKVLLCARSLQHPRSRVLQLYQQIRTRLPGRK